MKTEKIDLSIVVPVYQSEKILEKLAEEIYKVMQSLGMQDRFELILVNDDSPDNSWKLIEGLMHKFSWIVGISLMKNFGQHNATLAGLNYTRGRMIIVMDDDLQHDPKYIGSMVAKIELGFDVCYVRYLNRKHAIWKKAGSWFNDIVARLLIGKPKNIYLSSFKAMTKQVSDEIIKYTGPYTYIDGLILDVTRNIGMIDIEHAERFEGLGNYNLQKSISLWLKMATSFSILPLRIASIAGMVLSTISFFLILYIVVQKILHPDMPAGWGSIMATVLFVGGAQLACIGLVGEYLGRAYLKLNRKPQFSVRCIRSKYSTREKPSEI